MIATLRLPSAILLLMLTATAGAVDQEFVIIRDSKVIPMTQTKVQPGDTLVVPDAVPPSAVPLPTPKPKPTPKPPRPPKVPKAPKPLPTPKVVATPVTLPSAPVTVKKGSVAPMTTASAASATGTLSTASAPAGAKVKGPNSVADEVDEYATVTKIPDPIEPVNRGTFWFNHQLYHYVFSPLNKAYKFILPQPVRTGLGNVINNTEYPVRMVNDLLQGRPKEAGLETEKFLYNTTVGVAGVMKPSDKVPSLANLPKTDTSATFAKWGIPSGCYIVWPIIGPKSARDTVGFVGDVALNPVTWLTFGAVGGLAGASATAVSAPPAVVNSSDKVDTYETMTKTSIDRYNAVKSAYVQNRQKVNAR